MALAVIRTGGKQYVVQNGEKLKVEKLTGKAGDTVTFETLLTADGEKVEIGKPILKTKSTGEIVAQTRDKKIVIVKYKSKTRYKRTGGHRQPHTTVSIS